MNVFIVLAHPERRSFNGAMFDVAVETFREEGYTVQTSILYEQGFDPVSDRRNFTSLKDPEYFKQQVEEMHATEVGGFAADVEAELQKVEACDLMLWQFPLWWFSVPAILKGWVDRVFAMGRTYGGGRVYDTGVFAGKRALCSVTTGGPEDAYVNAGFNGDIHSILRPVHRGMLAFTGFDVLAPHLVYAPVRMSDDERSDTLATYAKRLREVASEAPVDVGRY